ncbi:MAG: cyclic nucleotide-binding domain-containing protein [Alphaproteobacteria bacterium]|nr:cyclic nucleotide-binding domain-containing protein [Alphaproteobacteria bacterium]
MTRGRDVDDAGAHTLAGIALFEGLDEGERGRIEGRCHWRRYQARQTVFDRESTSREVFFVAQGTVRVVNYTLSGREIAFATLAAGEYFGELAAIDALPRTASVQAIEDSLLAFLQANVFLDLLHRRGEIAFRVLERLVRVVRESTERIMDLSTLGAIHWAIGASRVTEANRNGGLGGFSYPLVFSVSVPCPKNAATGASAQRGI